MLAETIKSYLREKDCLVVFEKVDGEIREMYCTTRPEFLDEIQSEKSDHQKKRVREKPDNIVCAYDTENNGWRSFRIESIKEFYTLEEDGDYYQVYQSGEGPDAYLD